MTATTIRRADGTRPLPSTWPGFDPAGRYAETSGRPPSTRATATGQKRTKGCSAESSAEVGW